MTEQIHDGYPYPPPLRRGWLVVYSTISGEILVDEWGDTRVEALDKADTALLRTGYDCAVTCTIYRDRIPTDWL